MQVGDPITFQWHQGIEERNGTIRGLAPDPVRQKGRKTPQVRIGIAFSGSGPFKRKVVGFIGRVQIC
jgi:hypothetical protein